MEPKLHSFITDGLPDDHPLAWSQVECDRCKRLVHAANNECMPSWLEFDPPDVWHVLCLKCAVDITL